MLQATPINTCNLHQSSPNQEDCNKAVMVGPLKSNIRSSGPAAGGRPYGFMLLLVVGAACLGFMVLHKLREGRILSLLVQEKDHQLISLHYLLQRERELSKETRKKLEETKTSLYSVKAQKMDVEVRLSEVESLISSLKDEQKIIESQLDDKRDEINTLKQQQMIQNQASNSELTTTDESSDIVDPQKPAIKVWSVSSDDPSEPPPMNFTAAVKSELNISETKQPQGFGNGRDKSVKNKRKKWRNLIKQFREANKGKDEQAKQDGPVTPKEEMAENVTLAGDGGSKYNETAELAQDLGAQVENKTEAQAAVQLTGIDDKLQDSKDADAREKDGPGGETSAESDIRMVKDK